MMNEPTAMDGPSIVKRLVEGIEHKARLRRPARSLTYDAAGEGVDHEGHVDEACQVATYVKSESQSMFGAGALKWRLTRSSGHGADLSDTVVLTGLPRMMP